MNWTTGREPEFSHLAIVTISVATYNVGMRSGFDRPKDLAGEIGKVRPFDRPEEEAYLNLVRTHDCLAHGFASLFAEFGISDPQYNVLRILRGEGRPMPVRKVAGRMVTRQPDVTRLMDRLTQAGLIDRRRCTEDRRVVWVELTDAGRDLLRRIDRPLRELSRRQLVHMGPRKLAQLSRLLFEARHPPHEP